MKLLVLMVLSSLATAQFESLSHVAGAPFGHPGWHDAGHFADGHHDPRDPDTEAGADHCCHAAAHLAGCIVEGAGFPPAPRVRPPAGTVSAPFHPARPPPLPPPIRA